MTQSNKAPLTPLATRVASLGPLLRPEWRHLTPAALLEHMHTRTGVEYFPVIDPDETDRDRIDEVLANRFTFNGETHQLDSPIDWLDNPSRDLEWQILLHKFYYAVGLGLRYHRTRDPRYVDKWVSLIDSWIQRTPPGFIAADVTGRRVQNWIYSHHYFVTRHRPDRVPAELYARMLVSLHQQISFLKANLHASRNHRTLELYAIFLAGVVFPEFEDAAEWRQFSLDAIAQNVRADLLADGVQCELSTDYHHIVLRNWLCVRRLAALNNLSVPVGMDQGLIRALEFSLHAHKPDGEVPSFSDGDVRSYRELLQQGFELYGRLDMQYVASAGASGRPPATSDRAFTASGYYVMRSGWGQQRDFLDEQYLLFDAGPLGAGNHGHFDCLSFELAAFGRSLIVDPGRYTYDESGNLNWRAQFRGTAAHNTVLIDGRDQTRYEPGPKKMKVRGPAPEVEVLGWHSQGGFAHLHARSRSSEYPVVHQRVMHRVGPDYWLLSDWLEGEREHLYDLSFQLDPSGLGQVHSQSGDGTLSVITPNLLIAQAASDDITLRVEPGQVSKRYGHRCEAPMLRFRQSAARASFHTILYPYRSQAPRVAVRDVPVWSDVRNPGAAKRAHASAIRIGVGPEAVLDYWFINFDPPAVPLRFGPYQCSGSFAWIRENAFGDILDVHLANGTHLNEAATAAIQSKESDRVHRR